MVPTSASAGRPSTARRRRQQIRRRTSLAMGLAAAVPLLASVYAALHLTTLDEGWSRPVSRALQSALAASAAGSLALAPRGGRARSWILAIAALLATFAPLSAGIPSARWARPALALGALWVAALAASWRHTRSVERGRRSSSD
ncbi:MAG: hypothetical protein ABR599_04075 [Gemmatimonadota bacterium]